MDLNHLCMGCMEDKGEAKICPGCGWNEGTEPGSPHRLPPRTILNNQYLLGKVLGQGGFGITYLAWDMHLERKLAIKEYFPHDFATRGDDRSTVSVYSDRGTDPFNYGLKKFLEEGKTLAKFQAYPGIVMVITFFKTNNTGYLVMEYIDGVTFKEYLDREGGKISYETALKILIPVMDTLREIHRADLLHRDISPDNICISREGQIKLLDFGAARYAMGEHTRSLSVILKDGYAPEEQYRSKGKQGPWTDVYALGATFYRSVTGEIPPQALDRLVDDELQPPSTLKIDIPANAESLLMKTLAVRAKDRLQTISEFQDVFIAEKKSGPIAQVQKPKKSKQKSTPSRKKSGKKRRKKDGEEDKNGILKPGADCYINSDGVWEKKIALNGVELLLIYVPPGEFMMGSAVIESDSDNDESPKHKVKISNGSWVGKYVVTQEQWSAVNKTAPWSGEEFIKYANDYPAVYISWKDTKKFISKLNKLGVGKYRLPTEAEWEYACRAGSDSDYSFGNDVARLNDYCWFCRNTSDVGEKFAHKVGQKKPNEWGFYDMHGNVCEWCLDWYGNKYITESISIDPKGYTLGSFRMCRGGSWKNSANDCRSAKRLKDKPAAGNHSIGFRLLLEGR